jgi:hypothetical protein
MLRCIAEKEDIKVMRYEFELGVSCVCHAHVLYRRGQWPPLTRPHAHLVSIVTGETEFKC